MFGSTVLMKTAAKANAPRLFMHVLRVKEDIFVRMALDFEVRKKERN